MPNFVIIRYIQAIDFFGLAMNTMKRVFSDKALRYSDVIALQRSLKRVGFATGTSPEPATTIAFRFLLP